MKKKIYLAGPIFSLAEQQFNSSLYDTLKSLHYDVFLPQKECSGLKKSSDIFHKNKESIDSSDIIIAILDGADADGGTCWECGYGFAMKKHIIAVRTDFRNGGDIDGFNAMLYESSSKKIRGYDFQNELIKYLNVINKIENAEELENINK